MKVKGLLKFYLPAVAVAMGVGSCQDYNADFNEKEARYTNEFRNIFGDIDPQQDWNMAQQITATLNLPNAKGKSVVKIYEFDPLANVGAKYFTDIDVIDGKAEWKFDAFKNDKDLFVQVKQGNDRIYAGYCTIEDGRLVINDKSLHKNPSGIATRAMGAGVGEELWSELMWGDKNVAAEKTNRVIIYNDGASVRIKQFEIKDNNLYYTPNVLTTAFRKLAYNNSTSTAYNVEGWGRLTYEDDGTEAINNIALGGYIEYNDAILRFKDDVIYSTKPYISHTYAITTDTKVADTKWLIGDCKDLFWEDEAPFKEAEDYRSSRKKTIYSEYDSSVSELEQGVLFTTSKDDAEINIPMMYGATDRANILGYYYYDPKTQDPREVNRYVLYDDAEPTVNIKVGDSFVKTGMTLQSKPDGATDETIVTCTTRSLLYFGPDGMSSGTTKFPKDLKIGFFIRRCPESGYKYNSITPESPGGETGFAYSTPDLNKKHFYAATGEPEQTGFWSYRGGDGSECSDAADITRGNVKAMTWNYGGRVLVGFGDDSGDCDLNDFVFWVNGDIVEKPKVKIEVKDDTDVVEWMVACEDLGGAFDYDFNDVVFGVKNYKRVSNMYVSYFDKDGNLVTTVPTVVEGTNYLVVTPYAAGGSLKSHVMYNSTDLGEIHSLVNNKMASTYASMSSGSMPILNADEGKPAYTGTPRIIDLGSTDFSMSTDNMGGFAIKTMQKTGDANGELIKAPKTGEAPQMMVLPTGWDWPTERNCIYNVYPDFENWANEMTANGWVSSKTGSFVTNPYKTSTGGGSGSDDEGGSLPSWNISITGAHDLDMNTTETYTVAITGASDLSTLEVGSSSACIASVSNSEGTVTVTTGATHGSGSFWVKYPGDASHKETKIIFNVNVLAPSNVFTLSESNVKLKVGQEITFTVSGSHGSNETFELSTSDANVATVSGYGFYGDQTITAVGEGTATITVAFIGDSNYRRTEKKISVTVSNTAPVIPDDTPDGYQALTLPTVTTVSGINTMKFETDLFKDIDGDIELLIKFNGTDYNGAPTMTSDPSQVNGGSATNITSTKNSYQTAATLTIPAAQRDSFTNGYYLVRLSGGSLTDIKAIYVKQ